MTEQLPVDEIVTLRPLNPKDDLSKLTEHIKKNGIKVPILITTQKVIIDGLRRLEAAKSLGHKDVPIVVADSFNTACDEVARARKHGVERVESWQRVWEIYRDTRPLMLDKIAMDKRQSSMNRRKQPLNPGNPSRTRVMLSNALGLKTPSALQAITHVHLLAEQDSTSVGARAQEGIRKMATGEFTPYQADAYTRREDTFVGDVVGLEDQRTLLASVTNTLSGVTKGVNKMGELNPKFTKEELNAYLTSLKNSRRQLTRFVRLLEEKANQ